MSKFQVRFVFPAPSRSPSLARSCVVRTLFFFDCDPDTDPDTDRLNLF